MVALGGPEEGAVFCGGEGMTKGCSCRCTGIDGGALLAPFSLRHTKLMAQPHQRNGSEQQESGSTVDIVWLIALDS